MKLIIAYIQPDRLKKVKEELFRAEVFKVSVTNALGCGQQKGFHEIYRGVEAEVNLLKKVRLEIAVNEGFVEPTIAAIVKGARTGEIGDGKIFVLPLQECVRIEPESGVEKPYERRTRPPGGSLTLAPAIRYTIVCNRRERTLS